MVMLFPHSLVAVREQHYLVSFSDLDHEPEGRLLWALWLGHQPMCARMGSGQLPIARPMGSGQLPMWERRDWSEATESGVRLDMAFLLTER
jgi:hypothetical protein